MFNLEHQLDVSVVAQRHKVQDGLLLGRPKGERLFPDFQAALRAIPEQQALLLLFCVEQEANASFFDETVVELAHQITQNVYGLRSLVVSGLSSSAEFDLNSAFAARRVKAHRDNLEFTAAVILIETEADKPRQWRLVGDLEPTLHEALRVVGEKGEVTASELALELELELKAASTRLKRLFERFLVWRQEHKTLTGREFVYHFWL